KRERYLPAQGGGFFHDGGRCQGGHRQRRRRRIELWAVAARVPAISAGLVSRRVVKDRREIDGPGTVDRGGRLHPSGERSRIGPIFKPSRPYTGRPCADGGPEARV